MDHDLNDLAVFAEVVDRGGFTAAAPFLGIPKSNISRRISRLEERLGIRLLERTTRKLRPTEVGLMYYQHCRRMLDEAEQAERAIHQVLDTPRGNLKVSASVSTGQYLLAPLLATFLKRYPEVRLQLVLANRQVDLVEEGFDLAIRIGELPDSTLVARRLGATKYALYASPSYLQSAPRLRTVADLPSQRVFAMSESVDRIRLRMQRGSERTTVSVPSAGAVNDFPILVQMLVDGLGIAALPDHLARASVDAGTLKRVLPSWSLGVSEFNAVFPSHRGATPKVRAFVDYLVEALSKTAPWKP